MVTKCKRCKGPWIPEGDLYCKPCEQEVCNVATNACAQIVEGVIMHGVPKEPAPSVHEPLASGKKYDQDKPMIALIPSSALEEEAKVWTFGANKYGKSQWKNGIKYTRILSALLRHTISLMAKNDLDNESKLHHAAHIRCNAGMLIEFYKTNRTDLDDRD